MGKRIIYDIKKIKNLWALKSIFRIEQVLDIICEYNDFEIIEKNETDTSMIYMLSDSSHLAIHTFPETDYLAFDLYTCKEYVNEDTFDCIFDFLVQAFKANPLWSSIKIII